MAGRDNQDESPKRPRWSQHAAGRRDKLADLLEAGLLTSGDKLVVLDQRWPGEGVVTAEGWIDVAGEAYWSPSGAAKALSGRKAEAGWDFWAVESADGPTLNELRARLTSGSTSPPTPETHQGNLTSGGLARRGKLVDLLQAGLVASGDKLATLDQRWPGKGSLQLKDGSTSPVRPTGHRQEQPKPSADARAANAALARETATETPGGGPADWSGGLGPHARRKCLSETF